MSTLELFDDILLSIDRLLVVNSIVIKRNEEEAVIETRSKRLAIIDNKINKLNKSNISNTNKLNKLDSIVKDNEAHRTILIEQRQELARNIIINEYIDYVFN